MKIATFLVGFGAALITAYVVDRLLRSRKNANRLPLPPGPKPLPFVGNIRDLPKRGTFGAHHWVKFKDLYGPISSVQVMGKTIIVVNDADMASEIFEKRSTTFSSRAKLTVAGDLVGWKDSTGGLPYNNTWRVHRKHMARIIGSKTSTAQYDKLQEEEAGHFLLHLLESPQNLEDHIKRLVNADPEVGSIILSMVFGYNTEQFKKDGLLDLMNKVMDDFTRIATIGTYMVDIFPLLRYVPEWFPGTGWKQEAKQYAEEYMATVEKPYRFVQHQMAEGKDDQSYLSRLLSATGDEPDDTYDVKMTAQSLFAGGSDTSVSALYSFFLAMTLYPDIQKKAQAEIDRVIGSERLPNLDDRENLPYIEALLSEVFRWHPIAPMGIGHASSEDATFNGYFIPAGAIVVGNIWWFTHDPAVYKDPMEFRPERYVDGQGHEPETDPRKYVFGFGRRICPGRLLAENTLYLTIVQVLAVFNIEKKIIDGKVIEPEEKFLPGLISHPAHFETSIKPRSPHHEQLIRSVEQVYPWRKSHAEVFEKVTS
ncbi:cytochrome p450 oxidoreductase [Colletotrichum truncatum]|uniref:Cytochrome p450 oxidoreductase n=1 Tax=Colletotrichum truncatum TaxID=5467 RepID=A0ACC3YHA2_COLTU